MKILYLIPYYLASQKTDHGRVLHGKAVARQPGVELRMDGPGWAGWDKGLSVGGHLRHWGWQPDWIWVYCPRQNKGKEKWAPIRGLDEATLPPRVIHFYDAYQADKFLYEVDAAKPAAVCFAQEQDVVRWRSELSVRCCVAGYVPNCAEKSVFYREGYGDRPIDCLLTGSRNADVYPWRERWAKLIQSGRIPGEIRQHPGHRTGGRAETERQFADYAAHLRRAKVVLCDSSKYRLFLQRYAEAAAAGCVIVGDMPDDQHFRETLGRHMVEVDAEMNDAMLTRLVRGAFDGCKLVGRATRDCYLKHFTANHWAKRFLDILGHDVVE